MKNRKLRLLGSLVLPLFAVATASVSTYAWFQAQTNVGISVAENSVSISVVAPDGVDLADEPVYFIYRDETNGSCLYSGNVNVTGSLVEDHEENFVLVDDLGTEIDDINIVPGKRLTFGIRIDVNAGSPEEASLILNGYASKNKTSRKIISDPSTFVTEKLDDETTDKIIRVEEAVEIYGQINSTGAFASSLDTTDSFISYDVNDQQSSSAAKEYSNQNIVLKSVDNLSDATVLYYFYTITLAESNTATFYQEYASANTIQYNTPVASSTEETRYFYKTTSGNSNCYEGLEFKITDLEITAG